MSQKNLHFRRHFVYGGLISLALFLLLSGDTASSLRAAVSPLRAAVITINPDDWHSLATAISTRAGRFGGSVGYVVMDFNSGHIAAKNSDIAFPSASLIKLPILCAAFQAAEDGVFSLSEPMSLQQRDRRGGSGVLKFAPAGTVYTNRELLEVMIGNSDNTAADLIVRQLGYEYLQKTFFALGLKDTIIRPEGFKLTSRRVLEDNMTSPRDMALLLEKIYKRQLISADASQQMLDILKRQHLRDRLPRFLPRGWEIAHKTGLLRKACHDVGIVFSPRGDYMICVLTSNRQSTYKLAKGFIASVGRITFDYYGKPEATTPHAS